ncbi:MAG: hypothetical protein IKG87_11450 [Clostridia bacterium]|nr:hypothetical protein [Clostridia bacterium]
MSYLWVNMAADYQFTVDANPDTGIVMYRRENRDLRRFFCACSNRTASLWCTVLICGIM